MKPTRIAYKDDSQQQFCTKGQLPIGAWYNEINPQHVVVVGKGGGTTCSRTQFLGGHADIWPVSTEDSTPFRWRKFTGTITLDFTED